ncbi:MAG: poly(A) polymerase [Aliidongia sp.]|nr:poly(A) polymerase [Aliidongia sp.]
MSPARHLAPPPWLANPPVRAVYDAIGDGRFVGGAVRDLLLGRPIGDLDLATPLPPDAVMARLERAGVRYVPTGLAHGTVTALAGHQPIEITSLRRDVETDGRHAIVAYTDDWAEDAARRDFTMNALYLDGAGALWDPVGGIEDCLAGRVRFVGDAWRRIDEDVLRLLRFYRFLAYYGREPAEDDARAACRDRAPKLHTLAGERISAELKKLLAAPYPVPAILMMIEDGVLREILPEPVEPERLAGLIQLEPSPDPIRRLAALLPKGDATTLATRLRLSVKERERLLDLTGRLEAPAFDADERTQRRALYRLGRERYCDLVLLAAAAQRTVPRALLTLARNWEDPALPVTGTDAVALGMPSGERIGELLRTVEAWWIEGDFRAGRPECLDRLNDLADSSRSH